MKTPTKFNLIGLSELIKELDTCNSPNKEKLEPLFHHFKDMVMYMQELDEVKDKGDAEIIMSKLRDCQSDLKEAFRGLCESYGKSVDEVYQYAEDPQNFTQQEWEDAQTIRRKVEEQVIHSVPSSFAWMKPKLKKRK